MKRTTLLVHHTLVWCLFALAALLAAILLTSQGVAAANEPLVTTWKTNAQYSSGDSLFFKINPVYHGTADYTVDWGDGVVQSGISGDVYHEYSTPGTYTVKISGSFPGFYFKNPISTPALLVSVDSWGDVVWQNADYAFAGATVMRIDATDAPDLSQVTSMEGMFLDAYYLNDSINHWDVSQVTDFDRLFEGAQTFNQPLNDWVVSSATTMDRMFYNARNFNQDVSGWDISSVFSAGSMFEQAAAFDQSLAAWDVSGFVGLDNMFSDSGMQWLRYDATLMAWSTQNLPQDRLFTATGLQYCAAAAHRQAIIDNHNWSFNGDSEVSSACVPTEIKFLSSDNQELSVDENIAVGSVLDQLVVVDGDVTQDTYSFDLQCQNPGADNQYFSLNADSLTLSSVLDFEQPADANADNVYVLCLRVVDQNNHVHEQAMTVTVVDVDDNSGQGGQVLGAVDDPGNGSGQVLADTDGEGATLAATGVNVLVATTIGVALVVLTTIFGNRKKEIYRFHK